MTDNFNKSKNISKHTLSNLSTNLIPMIVALVTIPIYLSYIGEERFGVLALILAFLTYFNFMDLGLGRATSRRIAQLEKALPEKRSDVLWTTLLCSVILGTIGAVIFWFFLDLFLGSAIQMNEDIRNETNNSIIYLALSLPFLLPIPTFVGALHATYNFKHANGVIISSSLLIQILPLLASAYGIIDISSLVLITLIVKIGSSVILFLICTKLIPMKLKPIFVYYEFKSMITYGGWVSILGVITPLLTTIDRAVIAFVSGAKYVTYYVLPYDLVTKIMVIPGSFSSALFPRLVSGSESESQKLAVNATKTLISLMTPVVLLGLFILNDFLILWIGPTLAEKSANIGEILLIGLWINALVIPTYSRHLARKDPKRIVFVFLFEIPIYLVLLYFGLKTFGIFGAALAWSIRVLLDTCLILTINSLLKEIFLANFKSFLIILISVSIYILDFSFLMSFMCTMMLLAISLYKDSEILTKTYKELTLQS